jgi:hypothetical protein
MPYIPTAEDIANVCDADRHNTGDMTARNDVTVAELQAEAPLLDLLHKFWLCLGELHAGEVLGDGPEALLEGLLI